MRELLVRFIMSDFIDKLMSFKTVMALGAVYITLQIAGLIVGMMI